jgi:hypothetical protein
VTTRSSSTTRLPDAHPQPHGFTRPVRRVVCLSQPLKSCALQRQSDDDERILDSGETSGAGHHAFSSAMARSIVEIGGRGRGAYSYGPRPVDRRDRWLRSRLDLAVPPFPPNHVVGLPLPVRLFERAAWRTKAAAMVSFVIRGADHRLFDVDQSRHSKMAHGGIPYASRWQAEGRASKCPVVSL